MKILYEDNHMLAIYKCAGMPSQPDSSGVPDAVTLARAYIKEKFNKPGLVYMGLAHRLDRPVSGVLLLARTSKAASRLFSQFKDRRAQKAYLAVVEGEAEPCSTLMDYLLKDSKTNNSRVCKETENGAQFAQLSYSLLCYKEGLSLLLVRPLTGRPHQIRVQLASRGIPIYADARYGAFRPKTDIALHAAALTVEHPTLKTNVTIAAPPPCAYPWTIFGDEVITQMEVLKNGNNA